VGAGAAIGVVLLTQWFNGNRQRTDLLTAKLEELFLLLVDAGSHSFARRNMIENSTTMTGNGEQMYPMDDTVFGLESLSKIEMYVRLYFPRLEELQKDLRGTNNGIISLAFEVERGERPKSKEISETFTRFQKQLQLLTDKIVQEKSSLVYQGLFASAYSRRR
jgi:hypothetical protein